MITKKALLNTFKKALNSSSLATVNVKLDSSLSHSYEGVFTISPPTDLSIDVDQKVKPKEMILSWKNTIVASLEEKVNQAIAEGKTINLTKPFLIDDVSLGHSSSDIMKNNHFSLFEEITLNNGLVVFVYIKEQFKVETTHSVNDADTTKYKKIRDEQGEQFVKEELERDLKSDKNKSTRMILECYIMDFAIFMKGEK